jgi:hypothetical protein
MSYGSQPAYSRPYSSWGWFDEEVHIPSYFKPQYIQYAAPRYSERSSSYKDRFDQNRSGAQPKKKVVKQVYRVKYDGRKNKSSDLNATIEKPITILKNPANDGKGVGKSSINIISAKSEQKVVRVPTNNKELPLYKMKTKPRCSIGLPKWQEKKLQRLSAEELKEKGLAWIPKRGIQAQKDDAQTSGATKAKEKGRRRFKRQLPRFAPNHQSHWSRRHQCSLPMPMQNSSYGMYGYPSSSYFYPWRGFLYNGGLPNYYTH